jgi:hypothetical protein
MPHHPQPQAKHALLVALVQQAKGPTSLKSALTKLSKQKLNFAPFSEVASTATRANKTTVLSN